MALQLNKLMKTVIGTTVLLLVATPALSDKRYDSHKSKKKGRPFVHIEKQINQLQHQIDNIVLTPGPKGDIGATGSQGLKGDTGATGSQGLKGDAGASGPQGLKGDTGATGPQGLKGGTGATGSQGLKGDTGATGPQGLKGDTGATGPQGLKGDTGTTGTHGLKGNVGATGPQGLKGDTGATGLKGLKGDTGATGAQGLKGDTGLTGSAGLNGTSCSVMQGEGSATISCEDGTMASIYDQTAKSVLRNLSYVSGFNNSDPKDIGFVTGRELTINKLNESSKIRLSYTDNFRVFPAGKACTWEIMIDGIPCPSQPLKYTFYHAGTGVNEHSSSNVVGYCEGIPAGVHTVSVYVSPTVEHNESADCFTGWNSSWMVESEEVN